MADAMVTANGDPRSAPWTAGFPDLMVLAQEQWAPIARRNRLLVEALAASHPAARFLFIESPVRPRRLLRDRPHRARRVAPNIWTARPVRPLPSRLRGDLADRSEAAQISLAVRDAGLRQPVLWTQDPRSADLVDLVPATGLIYDLTDNWEAFESEPVRRSQVAASVQRLLHRADLVLACSESLCHYARERGADPVLVPNASGDMSVASTPHLRLAGIPEPILGYLGTLHEARLDVNLLVRVAQLRRDWSFVLVGPNHLTETASAVLERQPNIFCLAACAYDEVPAYLRGFSVGLVPHIVNELSESLDPLKMYEYASAGLPIIATAAGIPDALRDRVKVVSSAEDLIATASDLMAAATSAQDPAVPAAKLPTWGERAHQVEVAMDLADEVAGEERGVSALTVSVVIVSFNTRELTVRAISSVLAQGLRDIQIVVVDNGSSDDSLAVIGEIFPEVELISAPRNVGFGPANNLALDRCRGDYLLLLNSDAMLQAGALGALLAAAERHPAAAVLGPRLINPNGTLQRSAWPFPTARRMLVEALGLHRALRLTPWWEDLGTWEHDTERDVDFLSGACLLVRRRVLAATGGFDESFPLYAEETDLQYRIRRLGWGVTFVPAAQVTHVGGGSANDQFARARLFFGAQLRYLEKHSGVAAVRVARVAIGLGALLRLRWRLIPVAFLPVPTSPSMPADGLGVGSSGAPR